MYEAIENIKLTLVLMPIVPTDIFYLIEIVCISYLFGNNVAWSK